MQSAAIRASLALWLLACSARAASPDLVGRVVDDGGKPLAGARVMLYTAAVRTGTSPMCPSCWADCSKSATSAPDGHFKIESLDPQLVFRVLVVAEGYKPTFLEKVNPADGSVEAKLAPVRAGVDPATVVRGRVVDANDRPVVGATVAPFGARVDSRRWWGTVEGVDPLSVTNAAGEFQLRCARPGTALDVEVDARGLASRRFALLPAGEPKHELKLGEGATVNGRLMKDGKPLTGVEVGMVSADRSPEAFAGPYRVGTDAEGWFSFTNVVPDQRYVVYGTMTSLAGRGAATVKVVSVGGHGSTADAGTLVVGPGYRVAGRVMLSDGKPVPAGTRVMLSRDAAWDSQTVTADGEGRFAFDCVPAETVDLSVRVPGYHVSETNESLDRLNNLSLKGKVDGDVTDLTVQLDPGPIKLPDHQGMTQAQQQQLFKDVKRALESRIAGVRTGS